ncbi:site-specific integrase [Yinghuangia aomiensis]|uniref:Site-specific integrase n=1 Tax=Yinghuangia aomiensis TaxID=676205 RepID=A0ABP9HX60_9ACTN
MPKPTFKVAIWAVRQRTDRGQKSAEVIWKVGTKRFQETLRNRTLADGRRAELLSAFNRGEPFDEETGLPISELRARNNVTWYVHARDFIEMKWQRSAATSRMQRAKCLADASMALVTTTRGMPDVKQLRAALYHYAFNVHRWDDDVPPDVRHCLDWIGRHSVPMSELDRPDVLRKALSAFSVRLDGRPAAPGTFDNKRDVFRAALGYAIELGRLENNPLAKVRWSPGNRETQVERASVVNPVQARALLGQVYAQSRRGRHLAAFFACLYYAGMRTGEAVWLRYDDCTLPKRGWGMLHLHGARPRVGAAWTDSGESHDERGLKARSRSAVRPVPIPPPLVAALRWHIYRYGVAPDGRLFRSGHGGLVQDSAYRAEWRVARKAVLTPVQFDSVLAKRPYDLRHACVSFWLNSGVDPTEVARRAGQTVAILLRVYAKCLDESVNRANVFIDAALKAWGNPES